MAGSIRMTPTAYQALLEQYRKGSDPHRRLRAHLILLLAQGYSWEVIAGVLFCSTRTIARWKTRVQDRGVTAVLGPPPAPQTRLGSWWSAVVAEWVTELTPRHFGFLRSRWCCGVIVLLLLEIHHLQVSAETVRRWLHSEQLVWGRPVVGPLDPDREVKLQALRQLLATLPPHEIAVFQDEVEVNPNPQIGTMWMRCGQQAESPTPGTNEKRYLAGSLNWRTGALILTEGFPKQGRNAALFGRHLDDLRGHLLCYRKIHVICDNARFHDCRLVPQYLQHGATGASSTSYPSTLPMPDDGRLAGLGVRMARGSCAVCR
jgi:transposase